MLVDLTLLCWPMIAERLQEREENPRSPREKHPRQTKEKPETLPEPMREAALPPQQERRRKRRKCGFDPDIPLDVPGPTAPLPELPPELLFGSMEVGKERAIPSADVPVVDVEQEGADLEPQAVEKAPQPSFALDDIIRKAAKPAAPAPVREEPAPARGKTGRITLYLPTIAWRSQRRQIPLITVKSLRPMRASSSIPSKASALRRKS